MFESIEILYSQERCLSRTNKTWNTQFMRLVLIGSFFLIFDGCAGPMIHSAASFSVMVGTKGEPSAAEVFKDTDVLAGQHGFVADESQHTAEFRGANYYKGGVLLYVRHYSASKEVTFDFNANNDPYHQNLLDQLRQEYIRAFASKYGTRKITQSSSGG